MPSLVHRIWAAVNEECPAPYDDVCIRVLTTSVGTRIKHAAYNNQKNYQLETLFNVQFRLEKLKLGG